MNEIGSFMDRIRKCPVCDEPIEFPESAEIKRDKKNTKLLHAKATFRCAKCNHRFFESEDLVESEG